MTDNYADADGTAVEAEMRRHGVLPRRGTQVRFGPAAPDPATVVDTTTDPAVSTEPVRPTGDIDQGARHGDDVKPWQSVLASSADVEAELRRLGVQSRRRR